MSDTEAQDGGGKSKTLSRRSYIKRPPRQTRLTTLKQHIHSMCYHTIGWKAYFVNSCLQRIPKHKWEEWYDEAYSDEEILKSIARDFVVPKATSIQDLVHPMRVKFKTKFLEIITPLEDSSYDLTHLSDIIVEYATNKYKRLAVPGCKYLYERGHTQDTWEVEPALGHNIRICNTANIHDDNVSHQLRRVLNTLNESKLLFHCTNWDGARNICHKGPKYALGRQCLDFGVLPSFYVTPHIETAIEWGVKSSERWGNEIAFLVFRDITSHIRKTRTFSHPDKAWQELTTKSRRCQDNVLDNMQLVCGPMVANSKQVQLGIETSRTHAHIKYQVASKSDVSDAALKSALIGVLFCGIVK